MKLYAIISTRGNEYFRFLFFSYHQAENYMLSLPSYQKYRTYRSYYDPLDETYPDTLVSHVIHEIDVNSRKFVIWRLIYDESFMQPSWPLSTPRGANYIHYGIDPDDPLVYYLDDRDRLQSMKAGRFLKRFHPDLTKIQIEYYARWFIDRKKPPVNLTGTVKFATTPDEIQNVYRHGPESCMIGKAAPRVYGAGDLAIAYLEGDNGRMLARCLVHLHTKTYLRIYDLDGEDGQWAGEIEGHLRKLGYVAFAENERGFENARVLKEETYDSEYDGSKANSKKYLCYRMPYLDWGLMLDVGTWTIRTFSGALEEGREHMLAGSDMTDGLIYFARDRKCVVCGEPAMTASPRTRINHSDYGADTELCPIHRDGHPRFTDHYSGDVWFGQPNYIDPEGRTYGLSSLRHLFWTSVSGTLWPQSEPKERSDDRVNFHKSEAESLGYRFSEILGVWTKRSEEEIKYEHQIEIIREAADYAYYEARINGVEFFDLIWQRNRPYSAEYAEVQETSRVIF